ncbi:MAG: glycosyltransferase [Clostridiales bacterium]|nr:glycosyltransferase [Clostridiales bacterium]
MDHKLSLIVPTYNCKAYLDESLGSVIRQMDERIQLIIVDDGSDDGTADELKLFTGGSNISVIFCEHKGASSARNTGLEIADGDYAAFMDCDDCLREGFLSESISMLQRNADLYIFGIERIPIRGNSEFWTVKDEYYPTISDFADEYIRKRQLMIYSNCNKFYNMEVIRTGDIRFDESVVFGEDRLFNYRFLMGCRSVITSSKIMLKYIQRSTESMSTRYVPDYFGNVLWLHEEKMKCFMALSNGTDVEERLDFEAYDLSREVELAVKRFKDHPREERENIDKINEIVFGTCDEPCDVDVILVLGSSNCEYKVTKAYELGARMKDVRYVVSGGNPHISGAGTEAEFMASFLTDLGVPVRNVYLENRAKYTKQNFDFSIGIIREIAGNRPLEQMKIGVVTGGFHMPRTRKIVRRSPLLSSLDIRYFPAYGPNTAPDNWYRNPSGLSVVLSELRKTIKLGDI